MTTKLFLRLGLRGVLLAALVLSCGPASPLAAQKVLPVGSFLEVGGLSTSYFAFGDPKATTTIVFLHGYAGSGLEGKPVGELLGSRDRRLLCPDWPGMGRSEALPEYSMTALVAWLEAFVEAEGLEDFVLAGHSLGGQLAIRYALAHPDKVRALVLIAPEGFRGEEGEFYRVLSKSPFIVGAGAFLYAPWMYDLTARIQVFHDASRLPSEVMDYAAAANATPVGRRTAYRDITLSVLGTDLVESELGSLGMPVLLLWGREDRVLNFSWSARFLQGLPAGAAFVPVEECGHSPHLERPVETARAIGEFLVRIGIPGR